MLVYKTRAAATLAAVIALSDANHPAFSDPATRKTYVWDALDRAYGAVYTGESPVRRDGQRVMRYHWFLGA